MFLELRDVVILNSNNDSESIYINRVRIYYNFFKILKGKLTESVKEISIIKSKFNVDLNKDSDLISVINSLKTDNNSDKSALPVIKISGKNLDLTIKNDNTTVSVSRLFFTLTNKPDGMEYFMRGEVAGTTDLPLENNNLKLTSFQSKFKITGLINSSFSAFTSRVVLKSLKSNLITLNSLSLQIKREKDALFIRKIEDSSPLDLEIKYGFKDRSIALTVISEEFVPSKYFHLTTSKENIRNWFSASITSDLHIEYSFTRKEVLYKGLLKVTEIDSILPVKFSLTSKLEGDKQSVNFHYLNLVSSMGSLSYSGNITLNNLLPDGILKVRQLKLKGYTISTNLKLSGKGDNFVFDSNYFKINSLSLMNFTGSIRRYKKDFDYTFSFSVDNSAESENKVSIEGNVQIQPHILMQMNIITDNLPLIPFKTLLTKKIISLPESIEEINVDSDVFISTDFSKFSFSILKIKLFDGKNTDNVIRFSATGNNEGMNISGFDAVWEQEKLTGNFDIKRKGKDFFLTGDTVFNTFPYKFTVHYSDKGVFISGDYGLDFALFLSPSGKNFMIHSTSFPVPIKKKVIEVTLDCSGYYLNNSDWKILFNKVNFKNLPLPVPENFFEISGELTQNSILLKSIKYTDSLSSLYGEGKFNYNKKNSYLSGTVNMADIDNQEIYQSTVNYERKKIHLTANFTSAPVERFKKIGLTGLVSGNLEMKGLLDNPDIILSLKLYNGLLKSRPLEFDAGLSLIDKELLIKNFKGKYQSHQLKDGSGRFSFAKGDFFFSALYAGIFGSHQVSSSLSFSGTLSLPEEDKKRTILSIAQNPFSAVFRSRKAAINSENVDNWDMTIKRDFNHDLTFIGGPHNSISVKIEKSGSFDIRTKEGFPVRTHFFGSIKNDKIEAVMEDTQIDMKVLNIIGIDVLSFTRGTAFGKVNVTGSVKDPDFFGILKAYGVSGDLSYLPDQIEPFDTDIIFNGKNMHIKPADLSVSDAVVTTEADFIFNRWIPDIYRINFQSKGKSPLHVLYNVSSIGLEVDGYVNGSFMVDGNQNNLDISGDLKVDNCVITLGQKKKFERENTNSTISVNLNFTTGRKVEFLWPSNTLPILKAYADTNQHLKVVMDGTNDTYTISGDIAVKYGEVYYFQRNFYLSSGSIIFNETEAEFDPILDFKAQIREVDVNGEVVNVYMIIDKKPLSQFSPRFESDPPLSTVEIMSMLGSNVFAQLGGEKIDISSALMLTGDLVSQFGIIRGFEQKIKDIFKLDLFSIRTQMIQNIIVDRFVNNDTVNNISSDLFGRYLDNTTLYLGKYFGNTVFLQTLIQFGTNSPLMMDQRPSGTLQVQTKVSLEWKTPLFLLDFSIEPDFLDPISSINNTSLSLSWGYSY